MHPEPSFEEAKAADPTCDKFIKRINLKCN
jgi:hypothetical protein